MVSTQHTCSWRTFKKNSEQTPNHFWWRYFGVFCTNIENISASRENCSWKIFFEFFKVFPIFCFISNPKTFQLAFRRFWLSSLLQSKVCSRTQNASLQIWQLLHKMTMWNKKLNSERNRMGSDVKSETCSRSSKKKKLRNWTEFLWGPKKLSSLT